MKNLRLFLLLVSFSFLWGGFLSAQSVKNQVINNCPDPVGVTMYVYAGDSPIGSDFDFGYKEASAMFNVSTSQTLKITDNYFNNNQIPMYPSETGFIWFYNGVNKTADFYNPYDRDISIELRNTNMMDAASLHGKVGLLFINGVTDAPPMTLKLSGTEDTWADSVDYNKWGNHYLYLDPVVYSVEIVDAISGNVLEIFKVDLSSYANEALCMFSTGFLYPGQNMNGPALGLCAATTGGVVIEFPSTMPSLPVTILSSPEDESENIPVDGGLTWLSTEGAADYHLQVSKLEDFSSIDIEQENIDATSWTYEGLDYNTVYYWRVRATDDDVAGSWSQIWQFTTGSSLTAPELLSPEDNATEQATVLTLSWNATDGAEKYHINVSLTEDFSDILFYDKEVTETSEEISGLEYSSTYYWRVYAANTDDHSLWSDVWNFTTQAEPVPDAPVLLSPENNVDTMDINGILKWNKSSLANSYHIQLSENSGFDPLTSESDGYQDTVYSYTGLNYETVYYWRVRAKNNQGPSEWSEAWSFKTRSHVSVNEGPYLTGMKIYPNPSSDYLFIENAPAILPLKIYIYSLQGIKMMETEYRDKVNISGLMPGVYVIRVASNSRTFVKM